MIECLSYCLWRVRVFFQSGSRDLRGPALLDKDVSFPVVSFHGIGDGHRPVPSSSRHLSLLRIAIRCVGLETPNDASIEQRQETRLIACPIGTCRLLQSSRL